MVLNDILETDVSNSNTVKDNKSRYVQPYSNPGTVRPSCSRNANLKLAQLYWRAHQKGFVCSTLSSTGIGAAAARAAIIAMKYSLKECILAGVYWKLGSQRSFFSGTLGNRSLFSNIAIVKLVFLCRGLRQYLRIRVIKEIKIHMLVDSWRFKYFVVIYSPAFQSLDFPSSV